MEKSPAYVIPVDWFGRLVANDEPVIKFIYQSNFPKIERYIMENSGNNEDARDVYQEAFIAVWRNVQLGKVTFTAFDHLNGYLFRVAQHKWIDELRKRKKSKEIHYTDHIGENMAIEVLDAEDEDYLNQVQSAYAALDGPCRQLLNRFYFQLQSLREIAQTSSWTEATARNNKYRCLQKLRSMVLHKK